MLNLNYYVVAATGVMAWFGFNFLWVLPMTLLASVLAVVFPPARLRNLRERDVFTRVFIGTIPFQAILVVLAWFAGYFLQWIFG